MIQLWGNAPLATRYTLLAEYALLSIKVLDPACGSGHFLLAAARRLGRELARVRTGEDHPAPEAFRRAVRDVIAHCIYGVDKNHLAVDLCKVALWLEGHNQGLPLTFLDHRIKCGDSLVGVLDLDVLAEGILDDAYKPVSGDDRKLARALKKRNKQERAGQLGLFQPEAPPLKDLAEEYQVFAGLEERTAGDVQAKADLYQQIHGPGTEWWDLWTACNLWTAAFFQRMDERAASGEQREEGKYHSPLTTPHSPSAYSLPITTATVRSYLARPNAADGRVVGFANALASQQRFFHWPLEFPDVFAPRQTSDVSETSEVSGRGFDVVLCNPPWERIKLQEKEFFATRDPEIANAPNAAARKRLIRRLPQTNPALWEEYRQALYISEATSRFLRASDRYPLTGRGDINTYSVFSELFTELINPRGRAGILVPTGIATDDTNKYFFAHLVAHGQLVSLFDFANVENIFPAVDSNMRFCLLTMGGNKINAPEIDFAFFATRTEHLQDERKRYRLTERDIAQINPNTLTCPLFRNRFDAQIVRGIYERLPVLVNERTGENPWGIRFLRMLDMSSDSHLFRTQAQLEAEGFRLVGNRFVRKDDVYLPLYEAKMMHIYDHRFAHSGAAKRGQHIRGTSTYITDDEHRDPAYLAMPRYWVASIDVEAKIERLWFIGFRNVTGTVTNVRTAIFSLLPRAGVGNSSPVMLLKPLPGSLYSCLCGNLSAMVFTGWYVRNWRGSI